MNFILKELPPSADLETKAILKKIASANRYLAELKGLSVSIPNQMILINTLSLQEAKDSSAIENIITTNDELFQEEIFPERTVNGAAKEVKNYASALKAGYELVSQRSMLTSNQIIEIQAKLVNRNEGFRVLPGTTLKNTVTGETVYTPPQNPETIKDLMRNLELFINDDTFYEADYLVKMAIIHYQFESIHPFYDGNGRTGRIINVLYLVLKELLDIPIIYLSRYIVRHKAEYYRLIQNVRDADTWEPWVLFMLDAVESTARHTITLIQEIKAALQDYKIKIRDKHKFYSQDLINHLFNHPYTRIEFLMQELNISRSTATRYLDSLAEDKLLDMQKKMRKNYYINTALYDILTKAD